MSLLCAGGLSSSTGASTLGLLWQFSGTWCFPFHFALSFILLFVGIGALCIILKDGEGAWLPGELRGEEPARMGGKEGLLLSEQSLRRVTL